MVPAGRPRRSGDDHDAIVIGAGHNGLITAAYLARAGLSVLLVEARAGVGGTAASEPFGGATVNICNCDHATFRTTPVIDELGLAAHGLRYDDVEPPQHLMAWSDKAAWTAHHDLEAEPRLAGPRAARRGRRIPRLRQGGDSRRADDPRGSHSPADVGSALTTPRAAATHGRSADACCGGAGAAPPTCCAATSRTTPLSGTAAVGGPDGVGRQPGTAGHRPRRPVARHATRRPRRAPGRWQRSDAGGRARSLRCGRRDAAHRTQGRRRSDARATAVRGVTLDDGDPTSTPRSSSRPATRTERSWNGSPIRPPRAAGHRSIAGAASPRTTGYESKVDAILSKAPVITAIGAPTGSDR